MRLYREMLERSAKLIYLEYERIACSAGPTYLIIIGQVFVHLFNIVFFGEVFSHSLVQLLSVAVVPEQHSISFFAVTPCPTSLLKVGLN